MKKDNIIYEFIVDVPPDNETIINFHNAIARGLINKYGEVVRIMQGNQ